MFTSFAIDNGIRFTAHFYDAKADKVETRPVSGWVTGDDGVSQATVLVPEQGLQLRVGLPECSEENRFVNFCCQLL